MGPPAAAGPGSGVAHCFRWGASTQRECRPRRGRRAAAAVSPQRLLLRRSREDLYSLAPLSLSGDIGLTLASGAWAEVTCVAFIPEHPIVSNPPERSPVVAELTACQLWLQSSLDPIGSSPAQGQSTQQDAKQVLLFKAPTFWGCLLSPRNLAYADYALRKWSSSELRLSPITVC